MSSIIMPVAAETAERAPKRGGAAVRRWLWVTVVLVLAMVAVGGATRLTGSGLSITEWRPVTGAIPPLTEADWAAEFARYRAIPQYELVNKGMSLDEFRFIYWWEWGHRQLGRFIGLFWLGGFLWFTARGAVSRRVSFLLFGMGLVLALQGAIGWIMVASGLKPGMTAVAPVKLTLHLVFACLFLASVVAMATWLAGRGVPREKARPGLAWTLVALLFVQIALGGFVAGSKAGLVYNTWPLMDGAWVPGSGVLFAGTPWIENFVDNAALVQFNHRVGAVVVMVAAGVLAAVTRRARPVLLLTAAQFALGVVTLLLAVPLWAGLGHQALAMLLLIAAVRHATAESMREQPDSIS